MKHSHKFNDSNYLLLKNEIEETFGKKICTAGDCLLLSEEIYFKVSIKVNSNTLRRFFGLVKSDFLPSSTTLEILSKYCGFSTFDELIKLKSSTGKISDQNNYNESVLNYLISLFKNAPVNKDSEKTFLCIVKHTIHFLQRHPQLIDKFQRAVSKTRNGQKFYFEQFVNIDHLNSFYGNGLSYYVIEKNTPEAQIFGHSLLCLKHYLSKNASGVKKHYEEVIKHQLKKISHPILFGRFFATQLLYAEMYGLPIETIQYEAQHAHAIIKKRGDDCKFFPYFEYIVSPVLLLIGQPEEALCYVNYSLSNYPKEHLSIEPGLYQTLDLIKALTLAMAGRKKEAEKLFQYIHPSRFYLMTKKTNTIMYLLLGQYLNKHDIHSDQQLTALVSETGFTKLYEAWKVEV